MHVTIINPNIVSQKGDFFGTGIPYMPFIPAVLAGYLREKHDAQVIDAFGLNPRRITHQDGFVIQGISVDEILKRVPEHTDLICIFAGHVVEHNRIMAFLEAFRKARKAPVAVVENAQAVTAYSLRRAKDEFFKAGADFLVLGDPEYRVEAILRHLKDEKFEDIDGILFKKDGKITENTSKGEITDLDALPFPAWDLFPLENYWKLGYSHAPFQGKYIALLTSRGCPLVCKFCVVPATNKKRWNARSAEHVVAEMKHWIGKLGIRDFHIEDLNPTTDRMRMKKICRLIIEQKLDIKFKFASGTKIETIDEEEMRLLGQAGCDYLSFSPESGSPAVLKLMNKQFNHAYAIRMTKLMQKLGIKSQACFVLGFPGETDGDLKQTKKYALVLARAGVDEIAMFIMTPVPGSEPFENSMNTPQDLSKLTFSPTWRANYKKLNSFRMRLYPRFMLTKRLCLPLKTLKEPFRMLTGKFDTKMEMTLYRVLKTQVLG